MIIAARASLLLMQKTARRMITPKKKQTHATMIVLELPGVANM